MSPPTKKLFTIGYQGRTLPEYVKLLRAKKVQTLCDVRRNPISRKPGFSRKSLSRACEAAGIRYEHLPELGIAREERREVKTDADRVALFDRYVRKTLPRQRVVLKTLSARLHAGERLALTCLEHDPCDCHRSRVAKALRIPCTHL